MKFRLAPYSFKIMNKENIVARNESAKHQYLAGIVVFLHLINYGISIGMTSPTIGVLISDNSPLPTGKISMDEASWIVSIIPIGGLVGNILYGFIINWFGRKWPVVALSIPLALASVLIIYAQNVFYLYIARALQGFVDGGVLVTIPVYFVEIANDSVRGILSSFLAIGFSIGLLLAYVLGNYCDYFTTPNYVILTSIIFVVVFSMFPETPMFLVRHNKLEEAEKSLRFYKSVPKNDHTTIQHEIEKLKKAVGAIESGHSADRRVKWSDFVTKPGSKCFTIAMVLALLNQLSGMTVLLSYTAIIFGAAGSALSPNTSTMIIGITQLMSTCIVTPFIDRSGRRFLYMISTVGTAFGLIALGLYMMLNSFGVPVQAYNWFPIVAFSTAIFISGLAIQSLSGGVTAEIMPDKLKEIGLTFGVTTLFLSSFFVLKFFPIMVEFIGFHGCMFCFATVSLLGSVFVLKFLPETKGKSYEEIMNSLR